MGSSPFLRLGDTMQGLPFQFEIPVQFFEKAGAPAGQGRRIGGIVTTERPDRQGEVVLSKALDWDDWIRNGWFNDNHSKATDGIVGYPDAVAYFEKGAALPDGTQAPANGFWAEGYLLENHEPADKIWKLGKALQGTGRRLGFSVEGQIHRRIGPKTVFKKSADGKSGQWVGNTIAKATVRNVAVTNCPVNTDTGLEILAKSLEAASQAEPTDFEARLVVLEKALAMGTATGINPPAGPQVGEGAGQVISGQSLERKGDPRLNEKKKDEDEETKKSLTDAEAMAWFCRRVPGADALQAYRFVKLTKALKGQGRL